MKALHRTVVGSAIGALAVATVAAGASYACTPSQQIYISTAQGPIGTSVNVQGFGFEPQTEMEVRWNGPAGSVLATAYVYPVTAVGAGRPQAEVAVTIPDVAPSTYVLVGVQTADGVVVRRAVTTFTVTPPAAAVVEPPADQPVPPVVPEPPTQPEVPSLPTDPPVQPSGQPTVPSAERNPTPAPATAAPGPSAPADLKPGPVRDRPGAPASPEATAIPAAAADRRPAGAAVSATPAAAAPVNVPLPAADDLWSGIGAEASPGLLSPPAPDPSDGTSPLGAVLLGLGALTLAGIALSAARGRLAVATAVARRR